MIAGTTIKSARVTESNNAPILGLVFFFVTLALVVTVLILWDTSSLVMKAARSRQEKYVVPKSFYEAFAFNYEEQVAERIDNIDYFIVNTRF